MSRRQVTKSLLVAIAAPRASFAEVTDETNTFAMEGSAYVIPDTQPLPTVPSALTTISDSTVNSLQETQTATDEVSISIPISKLQSASLGVELSDVVFRTNRRVFINSVLPSSVGAQYNIKPKYVIVSINGKSAERTNARGVAQMIGDVKKSNAQSLDFVFRDGSFKDQLNDLSATKEATTQVAPAGDTTQRNQDGSIRIGVEKSQADQKLTVTQLLPPKMCKRGATIDDLLEISYVGSVLETGQVFDGSAVKINGEVIPGRGGDVSVFFVLGKQPFGQFPPGWDVGLSGMCVGERRRVVIPPVLAYGSEGIPRRRIPPNATLVYDVSLVSINGLAMPQ